MPQPLKSLLPLRCVPSEIILVPERSSVPGGAADSTRLGWRIMVDKSTGMAGKIWHTKKGKADLGTPCGDKHEWKQMSEFVKHCRKYRCEREGCGFFKKCWTKCADIDCKGCHVPAHKRW